MDLLNLAYEAWSSASGLRQRRERFKKFAFGRQWDDIMTTSDGLRATEGEIAARCGYHPQTNNLLRQLIKTVIGLYRRDYAVSREGALGEVAARNCFNELDARTLEEFLISGCAVHRVVSEKRPGGEGVWVDMVNPRRFFVNRYEDPRGGDIELVGMLHDMSAAEALSRFGRGCPGGAKALREILSVECSGRSQAMGEEGLVEFTRAPAGRVRLIELWTLEVLRAARCYDPVSMRLFITEAGELMKVRRENRRRSEGSRIVFREFDSLRWRCRWLSGGGAVVSEHLSGSPHGWHPFVVKMFPLLDGEVHPFIEDVIDQQRYVNRMITLIDHVLQSSAKGVLLFPEERKPEGYSWDDIGELWSDCRGVIPLRSTSRSTAVPTQVVSGGAPESAHRLLSTQLELMERISGVGGALSGRELGGHASAGLYDAYHEHATTGLRDSLDSFGAFIATRDKRVSDEFKVS